GQVEALAPSLELETPAFNEADPLQEEDRAVRRHLLARTADLYLKRAHRWLEKQPRGAKKTTPSPRDDAVEIIGWYHMFIHVKLCRALHGLADDEDFEQLLDQDGKPFPKDSDGSAKIAIIGIERSFAAWSIIRDHV